MNIFDLCEYRDIEIQTNACIKRIPAWVYQQFAVNRSRKEGFRDYWIITHLASGRALGASVSGVFTNAEDALRAAVDIQSLRNDWSAFRREGYSGDATLKERVEAVCKKHGGMAGPPITSRHKEDVVRLTKPLNDIKEVSE